MANHNKDKIKKEIIDLLPRNPGVYRFYNEEGKVIYVGKAKNLKNRVTQYFNSTTSQNAKTQLLVEKIADVKYTVVDREEDALLLENNLIKEYQPRYNILLKDSKTYPWIVIKNEPFPRIFTTRRIVKDGSLYFGPYSSAHYAKHLIDLLHDLFRLRTCNLKLTPESIANGAFKECLNWHIKKCSGACIGKIDEADYALNIAHIKSILKGNISPLIREFKANMLKCSESLHFEEAQEYKDKIDLLRAHYNKSLIVQSSLTNIDVFTVVFDENKVNAFGNYLRICEGAMTQVLNISIRNASEQDKTKVLALLIIKVYDILREVDVSPNKEIVTEYLPDLESLSENYINIKREFFHIPQRGDKLSLIDLSKKNAREYMLQTLRQENLKNPSEKKSLAVQMLKNDLHLENEPIHIECFDNSNIQGTNAVASCVVFRNGKPSKKDYRKFTIKTVVGANDFASMYEVVSRRYSRLIEENSPLPQLIVIDGGRGQLDFAYKALCDLDLQDKIAIIGIAKRLEELLKPGDPNPLFIDKNSPSLKLIMQLRDEAHRFGITFHRSKRSKGQLVSELDQITGVGPATKEKLLQTFKSVKVISQTDLEDLTTLLGRAKAKIVFNHFHKN